jgi:hypothetical protein
VPEELRGLFQGPEAQTEATQLLPLVLGQQRLAAESMLALKIQTALLLVVLEERHLGEIPINLEDPVDTHQSAPMEPEAVVVRLVTQVQAVRGNL